MRYIFRAVRGGLDKSYVCNLQEGNARLIVTKNRAGYAYTGYFAHCLENYRVSHVDRVEVAKLLIKYYKSIKRKG